MTQVKFYGLNLEITISFNEYSSVMDCLLHNEPASCGVWRG